MNKEEILYQIKVYDDDYSDNVPDEWRTGNGKSRQTYDIEKHRYIIEYVSDNYDVHSEIQRLQQENKQLKEKIDNISSIVEYWGYDKEINDISYFRKAMKSIKEILGDKENEK